MLHISDEIRTAGLNLDVWYVELRVNAGDSVGWRPLTGSEMRKVRDQVGAHFPRASISFQGQDASMLMVINPPDRREFQLYCRKSIAEVLGWTVTERSESNKHETQAPITAFVP